MVYAYLHRYMNIFRFTGMNRLLRKYAIRREIQIHRSSKLKCNSLFDYEDKLKDRNTLKSQCIEIGG